MYVDTAWWSCRVVDLKLPITTAKRRRNSVVCTTLLKGCQNDVETTLFNTTSLKGSQNDVETTLLKLRVDKVTSKQRCLYDVD